MNYLYAKKNWMAAVMAAWGYTIYFSVDMINGRTSGYDQSILMYISKPAFIYMAVLMLAMVYMTLEFKGSECFELCFGVYGRRNCGFVFGVLGLNAFLSLLTFAVLEALCCKKYGFDKFFFGVVAQRVLLSYVLGGTFCVLAGFSVAYYLKVKGAIVMAVLFIVIASPKLYEMLRMRNISYSDMLFFQNFDVIQGHDGMLSAIDIGNMKAYKWIKIAGMIALGLIAVVRLTVKRSRVVAVGLLGCFICCEAYYYGVHDRSSEEFMNLNQDSYYQVLQQSGGYYNQYYDFESPFVIESYDLDMKFTDKMNVRCEMKLAASDADRDEYMFTLYHTLKVKSVTYDGRKISYKQEGDCIKVGALGEGVIAIEYSGFVDRNIANRSAVFLSDAIPYYPLAGKRMVGNSTVIMNDFDSLYKVRVDVPDVYTNLDKTSEKTFEGRCKGPCIVKGLVSELDVDGITVLVPKYPDTPVPDTKKLEIMLKNFVPPDISGDIKFIGIGLGGYYRYVYDLPFNGYLILPVEALNYQKENENVNNI